MDLSKQAASIAEAQDQAQIARDKIGVLFEERNAAQEKASSAYEEALTMLQAEILEHRKVPRPFIDTLVKQK